MLCEKKAMLVEEQNRAAIAYSHAMILLNRNRAATTVLEYKQLRAAADDALGKCKESRMALARHKAEHGC
jgi:hypothetical protein